MGVLATLFSLGWLAAPPAHGIELWVAAQGSGSSGAVQRYDFPSGAFIDTVIVEPGTSWHGVAFVPANNTMLVCRQNFGTMPNSVARFDAFTGTFTGNLIASGQAGLLDPLSLTVGPDGLLYVSAITTAPGNPGAIFRYDPVTGATIGTGIFANLGTVRPIGLGFDAAGNLYAADFNGNGIARITPGGVVSLLPGTAGAQYDGMTLLPDQTIWVTAPNNNRVFHFALDGTFLGELPNGGPGLQGPTDIAVGPDGNLYVANFVTQDILRYTTSGTFLDVWADLDPFLATGKQINFAFFVEGGGAVPEPSTCVLLSLGGVGLLAFAWRRRGRAKVSRQVPG
jgi:DNA-binding beta-propeller fold protein YncE